jgi:hypothetical protein
MISKKPSKRSVLVLLSLACLCLMAIAQSQVSKQPSLSKAGQVYIKVTSPGAGTVWERGKTYPIRWESQGVRGDVRILLIWESLRATQATKEIGASPAVKSVKPIEIVKDAPNSGSYDYVVPNSLPDGIYKVQITTVDMSVKGTSEGTVAVGGQQASGDTKYGFGDRRKDQAGAATAAGAKASASGATPPPGVSGKSQVEAQKVVKVQVTPEKVSAAELNNFKFQASAPRASNLKIGGAGTTGRQIDVTSPKDGDKWENGKEYGITWGASGISGDVKIVLEKIWIHAGGKQSVEEHPIVERTANSGSYRFFVPMNYVSDPYGYHVRVSTLDGKASGKSRGAIIVNTRPIDLECMITDLGQRTQKTVYYYKPTEGEKSIRFNVWFRNKGTRSPISITEVLVRIIKEPEGVVCEQEEWGFGGIYHNDWYKLHEPRKFVVETWEHFAKDFNRNINLKAGAYRIEVELDPNNRLGEDEQLRSDNKTSAKWVIK